MSTNDCEVKLIHAGFFRTGSASVALALDHLGYGPVWHPGNFDPERLSLVSDALRFWYSHRYDEKLRNGEDVNLDVWLQKIKCKSLMDSPVSLHWESFFNKYPNAKVIVTCRDFDKWYKSLKRVIFDVILSPISIFVAYFCYPFNRRPIWVQTHIKTIYDKMKWQNKESAQERYLEEIEYIKNKVPSEQLLIYKIGSGWEPLCKFLDKDIPKQPFPFTNKSNSLTKIIYYGMLTNFITAAAIYGTIAFSAFYAYRKVT